MAFTCFSCCNDCRNFLPASTSYDGPYRLANYLPAGVIILPLLDDNLCCDHTHVEDGWHLFSAQAHIGHVENSADDVLLRSMDFLTAKYFIFPTCRRPKGIRSIYVRVYIIPFDLAGIQGRLRARHPEIIKEAGKAIRAITGRILQDKNLWQGYNCDQAAQAIIDGDIDNRTATRIYSDLASPDAAKLSQEARTSPACNRITAILSQEPIDGLRSSLYRCQAESVAAMLAQESRAFAVYDPLYLPLTGIDGRVFYFRPGDMEILRECPTMTQPCGGVLCEELGTGKTVMILALILATIDQLSQPEESIPDTRPIMTPLSLRNFPFTEPTETRRRLHIAAGATVDKRGHKIPSLSEILIHHLRAAPEDTGIRTNEELLERLPLWHLYQANTPFYYHYDIDIENSYQRRTSRKPASPGPRRMYLTTASLIVVPVNLVDQWDSEIQKHCDTRLRVFVERSGGTMPSASRLASEYDIVLLNHNSLSFAKTDISGLHSWHLCECPCFPGTRLPDCHCDEHTNISPLLQIRWKRLVIDEGHVSSTIHTNLSQFTVLLSAERRWIVTGTPTTNLLGLSFGSSREIDKRATANADEGAEKAVQDAVDPTPAQQRKWTDSEREDLRKLGTMITHFLGVRHFADQSTFNKFVVAPLFDADGPLPGAVQVLAQVMELVMIRHRIEDVEKDVILPPLRQETVLLDLDPYSLKSYNALQAIIAVNAIDSERVDRDYLFHPANVDALLQAIENMTQVMFWHTDSALFNVEELNRSAPATMQRAISRGISPDDAHLLNEAMYHMYVTSFRYFDPRICLLGFPVARPQKMLRGALCNQYRVCNVSNNIQRAWSRLETVPNSISSLTAEQFLQPDRLVRLRDMITTSPLASAQSLIEWGHLVAEEDRHKQLLISLREKVRKGHPKSKTADHDIDSAALKAVDVAKKEKAPEKIKEVLLELEAAQGRLVRAREGIKDPEGDKTADADVEPGVGSSVWASFLARSPVAGLRVGRTTSSKLNYVLSEVAQHASEEKFLIFSKMPLSLAYVAEGLDVIGVRYLQFTSNVDVQVRRQLVMTFQSSDKYRVFLMDLKHGARGLNLTTASRIIFCEPVWQADVESQAIKRAHRIGQTRPITVKTLAIRSTSEEVMVARREALKDTSGKVPSFVQESGMRHFIAHPKFLQPLEYGRTVDLDIPLFPDVEKALKTDAGAPSTSISPVPPTGGESVNVLDPDNGQPVEARVKRRKIVAFTEPEAPSQQEWVSRI
ncbi:hypothetical protein OE88DRAFT_1693397 [Heliocybe sulcata]|uniref:Helicase C-terminal domain-containing protein n=1 Tax=Heliocybe sulcata TaxID=5364 RepID=A0A5C3N9W3_9AGAM|nr:hypothetical protein OE88DRAFT_1693397 [Heliocybe sulcata]